MRENKTDSEEPATLGGATVSHSIWIVHMNLFSEGEEESEFSHAWSPMHSHAALIKMECTKIFSPCGHVGLCASISLQKTNLGILGEVGREASSGLAGSLGICSVLSHLSTLPSTCVNAHASSGAGSHGNPGHK